MDQQTRTVILHLVRAINELAQAVDAQRKGNREPARGLLNPKALPDFVDAARNALVAALDELDKPNG